MLRDDVFLLVLIKGTFLPEEIRSCGQLKDLRRFIRFARLALIAL
jgi:hypothetical protein